MDTKKILIENIRNISRLEFQVPSPGLHIITGKNGVGKTTLFTCISRISNNNAYRLGFPSSNTNNLDVFSGSISYSVNNDTVKYSRRASGEWRPDKRSTVLQDFSYPQIFYFTTKDERIFSQGLITPRRNNSPDQWLNNKLNAIFSTTKFTQMIRITTGDLRCGRGSIADGRRRNTAYAIPLENNRYYTEQNFSFGEIVMLNLLHDVKKASNGSFILIDELELALHPSAQVRLISCLRDLANEKGLTIIISTHSASIIKAEKSVILLEQKTDNVIDVIYQCPPAKAIGAIGMREDTMPDIIVLVEDKMAKSLFYALKQRYNELQNENSYLDIRILEIGGFSNVVNFYVEAKNYIFYNNIYVTAFLDKDVETDIIPYDRYGNQDLIRQYHEHSAYLRFLPYTPEVLLVKTFIGHKNDLLSALATLYDNQQLQYSLQEAFNFNGYEAPLPEFQNQADYKQLIESRGAFRKRCKEEAERIAKTLADQINQTPDEIYRFTYKFAVAHVPDTELNVRSFLAATMKRLRR
jgi:predicted ATPase